MARRVFFSFHYDDIFKVNQVRRAGEFVGYAVAGFQDSSMWETLKSQSEEYLKRKIREAMASTTVTVVLIGEKTASRRFVDYEIRHSIERGNGLLGVHISSVKDQYGKISLFQGSVPSALKAAAGAVHPSYDRDKLPSWIEAAARAAGL